MPEQPHLEHFRIESVPRAVLALSVVLYTALLFGVPNVACLTRSEDEVKLCLHLDAPNDGCLAFRATEAEGLRRYVLRL